MIKALLSIVKLIVMILPFVVLCFANRKANIPKPERSKQFLMPVVAIAYVTLAMILMDQISIWLLKLIRNIPIWISSLASVSWMPGKIGSVFSKIGEFLTNLINRFNLNFWVFFIANTVIILVYITVKKICTKIMQKSVKTDGAIHTKIAEIFYEYFSEKNTWCIKENYYQVRSLLKVFYFSAVILSSVLMIISRWLYFGGLLKAVFYPVYGIIIVGELYFYLDGLTKREYSQDILGEDENAYKTVNYSLLRKFLRNIFGDKLLSENTSINNALAYNVTTDEIIKELEKSEDEKIVTFASYIDALNKTGVKIDHNYVHSSLDMLNGKSILFNNPFYNDLIPYAFYPMNRTLLSHKKVLVVLGRHAIEEDIRVWIEKGIESVTNIPFLWKIGVLDANDHGLDIGIVTRSDVLDIELQNKNVDFLEKVGFVVILEPSKLISTAQIGLNLLVKKCNSNGDNDIVYCMCDKNCDGLVDAMSHVLMTSITEVSATEKHLGTSSYMSWEADEDYLHHRLVPNISRYLGMGTELSFAALKNQVSKTKWYGGDAFPVTDMRWISRQYYYDLTRYASLPTSQDVMDEHFITTPNFWSAEVEKNGYMTVEDEDNNMFEILRDFSTRTTEQGFINIISSDYLLKDYMADNASIFEADPKAIPNIVADYTRSNRNTILRLVLMMSTYPVPSEVLEKEFSLLGINVFDLKKQIWYEIFNCYSKIVETTALPEDYNQAVEESFTKTIKVGENEWGSQIISNTTHFNIKLGRSEVLYSITDIGFIKSCVSKLRSAGYVAEDEEGQKYYLGAELSGHIYQKYLPGQFFTIGGKYYEMQYLTADGQILVRRAADHITGRPSYRQIREYVIHNIRQSDKIGTQQNISGMKITKGFADITVNTAGYFRMEKYNNFTSAKKVLFEGEKSGIPKRDYCNKEILSIELPDFDGKLSDKIRYTITVMLNEVFRTVFAENQAYICAVTDESFMEDPDGKDPLTYSVKGDEYEIGKNTIYIIEDSQLDLGLTVAVERNIKRLLNIVWDYLEWHFEAMELSLNPPVEPEAPVEFADDFKEGDPPKAKKKKGVFSAIGSGIKKAWEKFKGLFKKRKKGDVPEEEKPKDGEKTGEENPENAEKTKKKRGLFWWLKRKKKQEPEDNAPKTDAEEDDETNPEAPEVIDGQDESEPTEEPQDETDSEPEAEAETDSELEVEVETESGTDAEEGEENPDDEQNSETEEESDSEDGSQEGKISDSVETFESPSGDEMLQSSPEEEIDPFAFLKEKLPYHRRYYMLYGMESEFSFLDLHGVKDYLAELGLNNNPLKQARESKKISEFIEATFKPGKPDARYCDFCGSEIYGVEYETLADGRDRCINCGRTAIKTGEEFRKIFEDVKRNMESFFGIKINVGIRVEMVNAKTLHKRLGQAFIPTPKSDGRVLGVAIKDKNGYSLYVENGSPRMASMLTMAHELTHIWQYINWNDKAIIKKYGKALKLEIYEGMAKWVEIQYAYLLNEPATAKREEIITSYRDDEYGHGFLRYRANYPFSPGTVITRPTPFMNLETPLDPQYCGTITVTLPTDGINPGDMVSGVPAEKRKRGGHVDPLPENPLKGSKERNPDSVEKYAYNQLNDDEKAAYNTFIDAIKEYKTEINDIGIPLSDEQMKKVTNFAYRDHPEIFWIQQGGATYYFDENTHIVSKIELKYCMTKEEADKRQNEIDASVELIMSEIKSSMSDYEVALKLYESVIKLVDYDTVGLEKQKDKLSAEIPDDLRSIYGVFVNKKAVCAGYSKAMQYLLNLCGIECTYVTSDTHAWNLIKLEGDYYHLDVTWGDTSNTEQGKNQEEVVMYDCFCITSAELERLDLHTPNGELPLPECTATKCNYHIRHGLYFEKYDINRIKSIVCEYVKRGIFDISFKFGSEDLLKTAKTDLIDNSQFKDAIQYATVKTGVQLEQNYVYSCRDDRLIIAFYLKKL